MTATLTDTLLDSVSARVSVDRFDLAELDETGMLRFRIGDRDFELRTGPRPTDKPYSLRVTAQDRESLQGGGALVFERSWGRLIVSMQTEDAR